MRSDSGYAAASCSVNAAVVQRMHPSCGSRYRQRQHSTFFIEACEIENLLIGERVPPSFYGSCRQPSLVNVGPHRRCQGRVSEGISIEAAIALSCARIAIAFAAPFAVATGRGSTSHQRRSRGRLRPWMAGNFRRPTIGGDLDSRRHAQAACRHKILVAQQLSACRRPDPSFWLLSASPRCVRSTRR